MANQSRSDDVCQAAVTYMDEMKSSNAAHSKSTGSRIVRNFIALSIVISLLKFASIEDINLLPSVKAFQINQKWENSLPHHPLVRQDAAGGDQAADSGEALFSFNDTNQFGFPFQNYSVYQEVRKLWGAFLLGAKADFFASNATACFVNALNLAQYDVELLMVKLMYGDTKNNILNTTLFLRNVSDLSYICLDALENNYVFWIYKIDSFGRDPTQITLGALQNLLGNVLSINKLVAKAVEFNDNAETEKMMYILGQIAYITLDFEPIVLDEAGFEWNTQQDGEIYLQDDPIANDVLPDKESPQAKAGAWYKQRYGVNATYETHMDQQQNENKKHNGPVVQQTDREDFNLGSFDLSTGFGLFTYVPGLKYLFTLSAPSQLTRGFLNGSRILQDQYMKQCDHLVAVNLVNESERVANLSLTVIEPREDYFETVFYVFDVALLATKIVSQLHPIAFNCYNAGESTYNHYYTIIWEENGYNPKNYIMNAVYNFGHIFDALRDAYLFVREDPRGQVTNVYDAGFSIGWATYLLITPGIAVYETDVNKRTASETLLQQ